MEKHSNGSHLGTYYRIAGGPLIARLLTMDGLTPRKATEHLLNPTAARACEGWVSHLLQSHGAAKGLHESFTSEELETSFLIPPRGLAITLASDPNNANKQGTPANNGHRCTSPCSLSPGGARGVKHVATRIRRMKDWRYSLDILEGAPDQVRTKLLCFLLIMAMASSQFYL